MTWTKSPLNFIPLSVALSVGLLSTIGLPLQVRAQSVPTPIAQGVQPNWNAFDPPEPGAPGRRIGGGSRGICPQSARGIIGLVPEKNLGLTISEHPTVLFYIPEITSAADMKLEFTLVDESDPNLVQDLYTTTIPMPDRPGVIGVTLPKDEIAPLEVNKHYNWYLSLTCFPNREEPDILLIGGWIKRVEPSATLVSQLDRTPLTERPAIYKKELIWYDLLATLAELHRQNPNDLRLSRQWREVLESVELGEIAPAPFIELSRDPSDR